MAVNLSPVYGVAGQVFDNNGNPLSGGKIYTYLAGTTTNAVTYTNSSGSTAHSNPIVLDGAGRVPTGEIWLTDGITYKFVVQDSTGNLIGSYDNLSGINSNFVNFTNEQEIQTATSGQTVFTLTTMQYQPGTNSLSVFVDGVNQYGPGAQYAFLETDSTTVTFISGLHVGAEVKFTTSAINASSYGDAFQISYTPPFTGSAATNVGDKLAQTCDVFDFLTPSQKQDVINGSKLYDLTSVIQSALSVCNNLVANVEGTYRIDGTIKLFANVSFTLGSRGVILERISAATSTDPIVSLLGNFASLGGSGTLITAKNSPNGILAIGQSTTGDATNYNCQYCKLGSHKLAGPGGNATSVGLLFFSHQPSGGGNYATYFATVDAGMLIDSVGIGVNLTNGCNAHSIFAINFYNIYTSCYKLQGAYGNTMHGGFCHSKDPASSGVTIINLLNGTSGTDPLGRAWVNGTVKNQFFGVGGEPGGVSYSVDIGSNANNNTIVLLHNTSNGPADVGENNIIIYDGNIANYGRWTNVSYDAANFTNAGGTSWTVDNADQSVFQYMLIGKTLWVNAIIVNTTVTGAVYGLKIKIPNAYTCAKRSVIACQYKDGATYGTGVVDTDPAVPNYMIVLKDVGGTVNWSGGANATSVYVNVCFEIS